MQSVEVIRGVEQRHLSGVQQTTALHSRLSNDREDKDIEARDRISQRKVNHIYTQFKLHFILN